MSVYDASAFDADRQFDVDVAIVGTGAGGGTAAEILSHAGLRVALIEEGPYWTARDFHMRESESYPNLYQESAGRKTKDKGINVLQGRSVGGSTTVNWTSSFHTPSSTLEYWRENYGLSDFTDEALAPWFAQMERRLNVHPWLTPNENNSVLARGAAKLGIPTKPIPRNVKGCWNLGYCGIGCPTNAKQSMLVTTIPSALERGAILFSRTRAWKLVPDASGRITQLTAQAMDTNGVAPSGRMVTIRAKHFVLAGGAIGTPALLLRSELPDPYRRVGKHTYLHPTVISAAIMPEKVDGFAGAPQSIYSDHFLRVNPIDGPIGFKLEVPPLHPILISTNLVGFGETHAATMARLPNMQVIIALMRDGFNSQSQGGTVGLKSDGTPELDYPITDFVWEGARRALQTMAEIQFAAGATEVTPLHEDARLYRSIEEARAAIAALPMEILRTRVASAHVMGGSAMGTDPKTSVIDGYGSHHHVENISVFDGSMFPTSIGANPQLSIYGIVARNATKLAERLK